MLHMYTLVLGGSGTHAAQAWVSKTRVVLESWSDSSFGAIRSPKELALATERLASWNTGVGSGADCSQVPALAMFGSMCFSCNSAAGGILSNRM